MAKKQPGGPSRRRQTQAPSAPPEAPAGAPELPQSVPPGTGQAEAKHGFVPLVLDKTVIAVPLLNRLKEETSKRDADPNIQPDIYDIVIDLNLEYRGGRNAARDRVHALMDTATTTTSTRDDHAYQGILRSKSELSEQYIFARLEGAVIRELVRLDNQREPDVPNKAPTVVVGNRAIYRIWPDFKIGALITKSVSTVKADAARTSFAAFGEDIVWAVMDSGIQGSHPHFQHYGNLALQTPLEHRDFTGEPEQPLEDAFGHGTHVAGIIAGHMTASESAGEQHNIRAFARYRDETGDVKYDPLKIPAISGMAPKCKLLSLKVLDATGDGVVSNLLAAIEYIQRINGYGRRIRIHGVNMSVGYEFEPEWFACGQSPLCVEVDRLVRSGVVVVVAAGNTGYGWAQSAFRGTVSSGMDLTINDPGNAALAITVGSTHRDMPHIYGVSYFSSKGPTGDGRLKPDLVAPGEKILSCAAGTRRAEAQAKAGDCDYVEDSGTSMAAPHVAGVIAAFLSIRREFIGQPEDVKRVFLTTATDLGRDRNFQGHGLVDLMRAIQSV